MQIRRRITPQYAVSVRYAARHYVGGVDFAAYDEDRSLRTIAAILVIALGLIMGMGVMFCSKAQAMSISEAMSLRASENMDQQSMLRFIESNLSDRTEALASLSGKSQTEQGITIAALGSTYCSKLQPESCESLSVEPSYLESTPIAADNTEPVEDLELASELVTDEDALPTYWTYQPEQGDTLQGDTIVKGDGKTVVYPGLVLHVDSGIFHITDPSIVYDDCWDSRGFDIVKNPETGLYEAIFWENHYEVSDWSPIEVRPNGSIMKLDDGSLVMEDGYVLRPNGTKVWISYYFHPNNGVRWVGYGLAYGSTSTPVAIVYTDGSIEIMNQGTIDVNDNVTFNWGREYTLPAGSTLEAGGDIQLPNGVRLYTNGTASLPDGSFVDSWDQVPPDDQLPPAPSYDEPIIGEPPVDESTGDDSSEDISPTPIDPDPIPWTADDSASSVTEDTDVSTIDDPAPSAVEEVVFESTSNDKAELSEPVATETEVETEASEASETTPVDVIAPVA